MNNNDFITVWKVEAGFTLCLSVHVRQTNMLSNNETATADWGDGCVEQVKFKQDGVSHTYKRAGTYTVSLQNNIEEFSIAMQGTTGARACLIDVKQWGTAKWRSLSYMFYCATNMKMSAKDKPNCSRAVSMKKMFAYCKNFNSPLNHWDTENVYDAANMLFSTPAFNQNMSNWINLSNKKSTLGLGETLHIFNYPIEQYLEKYNANKNKDEFLSTLNNEKENNELSLPCKG